MSSLIAAMPLRFAPASSAIAQNAKPVAYPANLIAPAITSDGPTGNTLESVRLVTLHTMKCGLPVQMVTAPNAPSDLKETK